MKYIVSILIALPLLCKGQGNLVPNGDFEYFSSCIPNSVFYISIASPWQTPTTGSPDYFNACCPPTTWGDPHMGVPENGIGFQYAHSGDGYAGFFAYSLGEPNLREYLQVGLTQHLVYGIRYEVCFHVSLVDHVWYAVNTLGAYLSDMAITRNDILRFEEIPQILNAPENSLTSKTEWIAVCDTFVSRTGNERFITIGNFHDDAQCGLAFVDSGAGIADSKSYYYIDDVSVIALDSIPNSIAEPATELALTLTVWPNPATSLLHIRSGLPLARLRLLDLSGRTVHAQEAHGTTHTIPLHTLPAGLYLLEAEDTIGRKAVQRVVK